jgi:hypothetical protein
MTTEAVTTVETAISQLTRVQSDETINAGIRDDAARSLQEAQTMLSRLKSTRYGLYRLPSNSCSTPGESGTVRCQTIIRISRPVPKRVSDVPIKLKPHAA